MDNYDSFCGKPFWNTTEFLTGSWPKFSSCFMSVCLVWIPCGLLFLVTPWYILWLRHRQIVLRLPFSRLNAAKLICQMSLTICTFVMLLKRKGQNSNTTPSTPYVETLSDIIKIVSFMLLVTFGQYERKRGVVSSILQFAFWTIYSLGQIIPAYSIITLKIYVVDTLEFVLFYLSFGLCVTLTLLNCWSEHPGLSATRRGYMQIDEQDPCPLEAASPLSRLTFYWMFSLLRTGYKGSIDASAMWAVPQDVSSEEIGGHFDDLWKEEIDGRHADNDESGNSYGMTYFRKARKDSSGSNLSFSSSNNTTSSSSSSHNSFNGSVASKTTVLENVMYTERTRLTKTLESPQSSTYYTQHLQHSPGMGTGYGKTERGQGQRQASLLRTLWRLYQTKIALIVATKLLGDVMTILIPLILRYFLLYLQIKNQNQHQWQGYGLCVLFLVSLQFKCLLIGRCHLLAIKDGISVKAALANAVYKKIFTLRSEKKAEVSREETVGLITLDCLHIQEFFARLSHTVTTPLLILMALLVSYTFMGPAAIIGIASLCLLVPMNVSISLVLDDFRNKMASSQNHRLKVLREIVKGIKVIKLFAWEVPYQSKVKAIRFLEMSSLLKMAYGHMISGLVTNISVYLASIVTFASFILLDSATHLDTETAFMILVYLVYLRDPLESLARFVHLSVKAYKSCDRIQTFLLREELDENAVVVTPGAEYPIMLDGAKMRWNESASFKLKNISLNVSQETLVAVVGPEGCGKSSLLSAMIGEMDRLGGDINRRGSVAYVSQSPWVQNGTLLDNITFGKTYRERKVKAVVSACQLEEELTSMGVDEDTMIGQNGTYLNKSQERRISIARALYHDCDVYILDEPLSGLEQRLAWAVFSNVMGPKGLLKNKTLKPTCYYKFLMKTAGKSRLKESIETRIIATNCLHILPVFDIIAVMNQGRIVEVGPYNQLIKHDGALVQFLRLNLVQERLEGRELDDVEEISSIKDDMWDHVERLTNSDWMATSGDDGRPRPPRERSISQIITNDPVRHEERTPPITIFSRNERTEGSQKIRVSMSLLGHYLRSVGLSSLAFAFLMFLMSQCSWVLGNVLLAQWTRGINLKNESTPEDGRAAENEYYISVFVSFGIGQLVFFGCFNFLYWTAVVRASQSLYDAMIARLFRAPLAFFDVTPLNSIISVFSKDIEVIDHVFPHQTNNFMSTIIQVTIIMVVITATSPIFALALISAVAIFIVLTLLYVPTLRQLSQLYHSTQIPIKNHFCDSLFGATTIRAFREEERFMKEFSKHVDYNSSYVFGINMAYRLVSLHLTTLSNLIVFITGILIVVSSNTDPGLAGISILFSLQLSPLLTRLMSSIASMETNVGSVEQIKQYSEIKQEGEWILTDNRPSATWPFPGHVEFHEFSAGDDEGTQHLLTDVNIRIGGGEKIGVISRTCSNTKCVTSSLFRLIEKSQGSIYIDGLDISSIGLHDLRNKLTVLPQDPVLFSGSLRYNLDPFGEFTDDQIWASLARVHLKPYVAQLEEQLAFDVGDSGENLSAGHRQLMCVARTLLRKTRVLVVEESNTPSYMDTQTDQFINNIIRMAFQTCTIITVTSRPQSITHCDSVVVLEDGHVIEYDSPKSLLTNTSSLFYSMSRDTGLVV